MSGQKDPRALYTDDKHKDYLVARNLLQQFDSIRQLIGANLNSLSLTPDLLCDLQGAAIRDIYDCAGNFRDFDVYINNSPHMPPPHADVPELVDEMCAYANSVRDQAVHVSAYLMWRINWIHPFGGGNGRTSRAIAYLALCCSIGMELPGAITVPEMIVGDRRPYYFALSVADEAWRNSVLDVTVMERLLEFYLTKQLQSGV